MTATITIPHSNEHFSVWDHPEREWKLIKPQGIKQKWKTPELWWRSMVVDPDGRVLSAGLPKFKNYGEHIQTRDLFHKALNNADPILFTEKLDGSLAIRSVIGGEVFFRTRGSFGTEPTQLQKDIYTLAEKYPRLMDPTYRADQSIHFEFCHPDHKIIIEAAEPSLTIISGVNHADLSLIRFGELEVISAETGVLLVKVHSLPYDIDALLETVKNFKNCEGVVVRFNDEQTYVKVKSAEYLAQHRLKGLLSPANAVELCRQFDFDSEQAFIDHLLALGVDWEISTGLSKWYKTYRECVALADSSMDDIRQFIAAFGDLAQTDKKKYAQLVADGYADQSMRTPCFTIANGKATFESAREAMLDKLLEKRTKNRK